METKFIQPEAKEVVAAEAAGMSVLQEITTSPALNEQISLPTQVASQSSSYSKAKSKKRSKILHLLRLSRLFLHRNSAATPNSPRMFSLGWYRQEVGGKKRWVHLAAPYATIATGLATLVAAGVVYHSSTNALVENSKQLAAQRIYDRDREERSHLREDFSKVQERLASPNAKVRSAAVTELTDLAMQPIAGAMATGDSVPFTRSNYPFVMTTAKQLAITLPMEEDTDVRAATIQGLATLTSFVSSFEPVERGGRTGRVSPLAPEYLDKSYSIPVPLEVKGTVVQADLAPQGNIAKPQPQLRNYNVTEADVALAELANRLADADKRALNQFVKAYVEYEALAIQSRAQKVQVSPVAVSPSLVAMTAFCGLDKNSAQATESVLEDISSTSDFRAHLAAYSHLRETSETPMVFDQRTAKVDLSAHQLIDTRDALATTLRAIVPPGLDSAVFDDNMTRSKASDTSEEEALLTKSQKVARLSQLLTNWERIPEMRLDDCFLAGADLHGVNLQKVSLRRAWLEGANLEPNGALSSIFRAAQITMANFSNAHLQFATLDAAQMSETIFWQAKAKGASFRSAVACGSYFVGSDLYDADFSGASIETASFGDADLRGASFHDALLYGTLFHHNATRNGIPDFAQAMFDAKTCFFGAYVSFYNDHSSDVYFPTTFPAFLWSDRNFIDPTVSGLHEPEADVRTKKLRDMLIARTLKQ